MSLVSFDPQKTTNAAGLFGVQSDGYVQGTAMADPATRNALVSGVIGASETLPMYGGIAIQENIPLEANDTSGLGSTLVRAANIGAINGFTVFDQATNGILVPGTSIPSYSSGMTLNFYRLGSGARIAVAIDPALVSLDGGAITQQVAWDFTNQRIVAYTSGTALPVKILRVRTTGCKTVAVDGSGNPTNWVTSGNACALIEL